MVILVRDGDTVTCEGKKLFVNKQASKGPGKEVVSIKGLDGSNGQQWVSLARLVEGENRIETQAREVKSTGSHGGKTYTPEQAKRRAELQAEIDEIDALARAAYSPKPKLDVDPASMTAEERQAKIAEICKYYNLPMQVVENAINQGKKLAK